MRDREQLRVRRIRTPEGITFTIPLGGLVQRFLARVLDLMIKLAVMIALSVVCNIFMVLGAFSGLAGLAAQTLTAIFMLALFLLSFGYDICLEWRWRGQTVGKRLLRLQVRDEFGLQLRFHQVVIRNLLRLADVLPVLYGVGLGAAFVGRHSQRLGDLAAGTLVTHIPKHTEPDLSVIFGEDKYNSFRAYPHIAIRLRQRVEPEEAQLAYQALLRRNELDPEIRPQLFHEFAEHFRAKATFPEEACLGLSDEKYVRNVVDLIFTQDRTPA